MTTFNANERRMILAALHAVSPSGGGSNQYTLARRLAAEWDIDMLTDEAFSSVLGSFRQAIRNEAAAIKRGE